jgi:iron(III) transport system ATP-binding protein
MVFQEFALWPHMTVEQNVAYALRRRRLHGDRALERAHAMLERVGLAGYGPRYPHELSGGEQQRVALARALVARPALLLFDEPLSSLDANLRERLRILIGELVREQGATAVYITHDQGEAFALGDEIGVLDRGRLIQHGPPEEIYGAPATPFVARFTGLAGVLGGRVLRRDGARLQVAVPSSDPTRQALLSARAMDGSLREDCAVQLMARAAAVRLCDPSRRGASLRAVVRERCYQGRGYSYVLELGERLELSGVFDRRRFERGVVVGLHLEADRLLAFAADSGDPIPPLAADALVPGADGVLVPGADEARLRGADAATVCGADAAVYGADAAPGRPLACAPATSPGAPAARLQGRP